MNQLQVNRVSTELEREERRVRPAVSREATASDLLGACVRFAIGSVVPIGMRMTIGIVLGIRK